MYRPGKFSYIYTTLRICKWRELCQCHFNVLTLILACNVCISPIHLPQMDGSLLLYHESIKAHLYHLTRNLHLLNEHSTWKMSHLISLRLWVFVLFASCIRVTLHPVLRISFWAIDLLDFFFSISLLGRWFWTSALHKWRSVTEHACTSAIFVWLPLCRNWIVLRSRSMKREWRRNCHKKRKGWRTMTQ